MTSDSKMNLNLPIYEQAAEWLIELREGEVDVAERERLDAWFRASPEHIRAYLELSAIWEDGADPELDRTQSTEELIERGRRRNNIIALTAGPPAPPGNTSESPSQGTESLAESARGQSFEATSASKTSDEEPRSPREMPQEHRDRVPRALWRGRRRPVWAAAAIVACAVAGAGVYQYAQRNLTFATDTGEQRFVKLVDGSTMELNSRSRVRIRFTDGERDVDLIEGQALFHVAKDPARPFIVHSGSTLVRAVGTQFDVYRKANGTTVTVVEGRVAVLSPIIQAERARSPSGSAVSPEVPSSDHSTPSFLPKEVTRAAPTAPASQNPEGSAPADKVLSSASNAIYLSAGEQITIGAQVVPHAMRTDTAVATAWIQHELVFDSVPLIEVAQEFNRYNSRQLVISDPGLRDFHITGIFSSADPASLLKFLRAQHDIVVEETDENIRVSKK